MNNPAASSGASSSQKTLSYCAPKGGKLEEIQDGQVMQNLAFSTNLPPPLQVSSLFVQLGQRIRIARIRRGWTVADLVSKAGINRNTLTALEQGKPGTAICVCFTVQWVLGLVASLNALADPDGDLHGKALEAAHRPKRAGKPRKPSDDYDF
jgi:DNA-binding XRE family transcriptional regulator